MNGKPDDRTYAEQSCPSAVEGGRPRTIRLEMEVDSDSEWPGDDAACQAVLFHVPAGVVQVGEDGALLIRSMTAEVIAEAEAAAEHPNVINALTRERNGWREEAEALRRRLLEVQNDLDLRRSHQDRKVWFFQGDGEDHIESMGNRMVVVIHAADLKRLVANLAQGAALAAAVPILDEGGA